MAPTDSRYAADGHIVSFNHLIGTLHTIPYRLLPQRLENDRAGSCQDSTRNGNAGHHACVL
jgi:hypothetical protein